MDFLKFPFFNRANTIASNINKKLVKNSAVITLLLLSAVFSLAYVSFIFFANARIGNYLPTSPIVVNTDIRNLIISILHTFSSLFAILYASFYIDKSRYDGKVVSPAIATVVIFAITLFLGWRCYFSGDLDILIFILALDGVMLSIFLIFLSILQYDIVSNKTARRYIPCSIMRTLVIVALVLFVFSIAAYYDFLAYLLAVVAHRSISTFQTDALVLFTFMLAELCLIISALLMFNIEHKLNLLLKEFTSKVRKSSEKDKNN